MQRWLIAFCITQLVEVPIYLWALRACVPRRERRLAVAFGASLLTHPVVWFAFPRVITGTYWGMVLAAEVFAVGVEAMVLSGTGLRRPLLWSLAANFASVAVGLICRAIFGVP